MQPENSPKSSSSSEGITGQNRLIKGEKHKGSIFRDIPCNFKELTKIWGLEGASH